MSINLRANIHACHVGTSDSVKQHRIKRLMAWLSDKEGSGKHLVSLYIPSEESIDRIVSILKRESDSIQEGSNNDGRRLQEALKIAIQHIKALDRIPENGLAVFAGIFTTSIPKEEEVSEIREIVPPKPIVRILFEVDNHFVLEPLREMLRDNKTLGLISLDSKQCGFGILVGERLELMGSITSGIPGKSGKGGQSQRRYEKERDMELTNYFHRVANHAAEAFLEKNKINVLIVGGPGPTKESFVKGDYLHYELANALLSTADTQSAGTRGVKEALSKASNLLKNMCTPEQKRTVQRLLAELGKPDGLATYGLDSVLDAFKKGQVEIALVSDNTEMVENAFLCKKCGLSKAVLTDKRDIRAIQLATTSPCARCGAVEYEVEEKDIVDVLEDAASQTDAVVEVISSSSEEKAQLTALGGIAAILRYKPK